MRRPRAGTPKRVPGKREQLHIVRVLTEGTVTEPGYFAQWARRNREIHVNFAEAGMAPLKLVQKARAHQRSNKRSSRRTRGDDFDEIWCVFELWLVLHMEDQTAHVHCKDIQKRADQLGIVDDKHLAADAIPRLLDGYQTAKERAVSLRERHTLNGSDLGSNPSSNVWQLVDRLI